MLSAGEFNQLVNAIGINAIWHQAKADTDTPVKVVFSIISKKEETLVNAYGINGVQIQVAATATPIKFDEFKVNGESYTVDDVVPKHERGTGTITSYTCYARGL